MSHTLRMQSEMRDPEILAKACEALGLAAPKQGTFMLFDQRKHEGFAVRLAGWRYPIVVTAEGQIVYDNYKGHWGRIAELEKLQQRYAAETVLAAMGDEWEVVETMQPNGELVLELERGAW